MNNLSVCVILASVILVTMAREIDIQRDRDVDSEFLHKLTRRKLCGTRLSQTLALVCENEYNTMTKKAFGEWSIWRSNDLVTFINAQKTVELAKLAFFMFAVCVG